MGAKTDPAARLTELMDERGWADNPAAKERATFQWMLEATREIDRLHEEVESLSRTLASRTEHLV